MTQRQPHRHEEVAYSTSRRPAPQAQSAGGGPGPRERATFVPPLDSDWDTPAFQRRGQ
jgi:cell division protein FtsZ